EDKLNEDGNLKKKFAPPGPKRSTHVRKRQKVAVGDDGNEDDEDDNNFMADNSTSESDDSEAKIAVSNVEVSLTPFTLI
ncbi:hypothetical protein C0991_001980, partial [Blastosporella zonata]